MFCIIEWNFGLFVQDFREETWFCKNFSWVLQINNNIKKYGQNNNIKTMGLPLRPASSLSFGQSTTRKRMGSPFFSSRKGEYRPKREINIKIFFIKIIYPIKNYKF